MAYVGNTPTTQSFISGTDYFNGDGSTIAFTLSRAVVSVNDIEAVVNNVVQQPNSAYTISGTTITFTSAPSAGTSNIYVRYLSTTTQSITPSQGTVSYSTLNSDNQSKLGISFKNRIINGAMVIDQRNAGASVAIGPGADTFSVDRWQTSGSVASKISVQQNAGSVTPPAGFTNYMGCTTSTGYSVGAADYFFIKQIIEGYNAADFSWGTVNGKTVTLSFQVYSSLTGTFGGAMRNSAGNQNYPFTYSVSAANTWTNISVTIPAPSVGSTWVTNNGQGIFVVFGLGLGSNYSGTANVWSSSNYYSATGAVSVVGTTGATWYITAVQLEVGTQATTFDYRDYGRELALCQRYYQQTYSSGVVAGTATYLGSVGWGGNQNSTSTGEVWSPFISVRPEMRTDPTVTFYDLAGTINKCTRLVPGVSTTHNSSVTVNGVGNKAFGAVSVSGASAGMIAFHYLASAEL